MEYRIESANVKSLEYNAVCSRDPHVTTRCCDLVVTGNEAADSGAVDFRNTHQIENNGVLVLTQEIVHHRGNLFAFGSSHDRARDRDDHDVRCDLVMVDLHGSVANYCMSFPLASEVEGRTDSSPSGRERRRKRWRCQAIVEMAQRMITSVSRSAHPHRGAVCLSHVLEPSIDLAGLRCLHTETGTDDGQTGKCRADTEREVGSRESSIRL